MNLDFAFAGVGLDRIDHRRSDHAWLEQQAKTGRYLPIWRGKPLITLDDEGARLGWVDASTVAELGASGATTVLLGEADGQVFFAIDASSLEQPRARGPLVGRGKMIDARSIAPDLPPRDASVLAQARSMLQWHHTHPRCARCGEATELRAAGYKRVCPSCSAEHFPRTDPVVIMAIYREGQCLLGRKPNFPPGLFTCLAGFIEPGESIEHAARREAYEEAGVRLGDIHYVASQPWPFPSQLMIGLLAQTTDSEITIGPDELEEARWFSRDDLQKALAREHSSLWVPPPLAIAHQLIHAWVFKIAAR